jgi:predicted NBD/HSP70 family sugar kinase
MAQRLLASSEAKRHPIAGIGVAVPGAVDITTGVVLLAPNLDWEDHPLKKPLEEALGVPPGLERPFL